MPASSLFYRLDTDQQVRPSGLEDVYAGPRPSACWLIGGGPSLRQLPHDEIARSPLPRMCMNLAGAGLFRPSFWTSYDPTVRFHRSIYLDPGVFKFVHRRRAMDLVPETTFKVSECPATFFFDRDAGRGFGQLIDPQRRGIVDWLDSMVQAIDILYRLGFRTIYLAGCEMQVQPSALQIERAIQAGVRMEDWDSLSKFVKCCSDRGVSAEELETLDAVPAYHFASGKSLEDAIRTDGHYFRIAQCLRLSRSCLVRHGLQLISVTPDSRLNDYFPYESIDQVLDQVRQTVGDPASELTEGLYVGRPRRWSAVMRPMKDVRPPNWQPDSAASPVKKTAGKPTVSPSSSARTATPALVVEDEGWIAAGGQFADAYAKPEEVG